MGCGRLLFFLICLCLLLYPARSFTDCFPPNSTERFWLSPSYLKGNPHMASVQGIAFPSFEFDKSGQSLALQDVSIMGGSELLSRIPYEERAKLAGAAASLDSAKASLEGAKEHQENAHALSLSAQDFAAYVSPVIQLVFFGQMQTDPMVAAARIPIFNYLMNYWQEYSSALGEASDAYDFANSAGAQLARAAQLQYEKLKSAGAGSPSYTGAAKEKFLYAESVLAGEGGFCAEGRSRGDSINSYFAGKPALPDFSSNSISSYLGSTAGRGGSSTLSSLADLHTALYDANREMEGEYSSAALAAGESASMLTAELERLSIEELGLIGEGQIGEGQSQVVVGNLYSGIHSGFLRASQDCQYAKSILSLAAESSRSSADGHLSSAISYAQESGEISQNALSSLLKVRLEAELAVGKAKSSAESRIAQARQMLAEKQAGSLYSAQALSSSEALLLLSGQAYGNGTEAPTLGKKYLYYTRASRLAAAAQEASESAASLALEGEAKRSLEELSAFLLRAKRDGLDAAQREAKLSDMSLLLLASPTPQLCAAISSTAKSEIAAAALELYSKYSALEQSFPQALSIEAQAQGFDSGFSCSLARFSQFIVQGRLDAASAAGALSEMEKAANACSARAQQNAPAYLSAALSGNAHASELFTKPVLGKPSNYSVTITTSNPTAFSSAKGAKFSVRTMAPLYSSDFSGGDRMEDAYPENGATSIKVSPVAAGQQFSFTFGKQDFPAQKTYSQDSCGLATQEEAVVERQMAFFASRQLPSLFLEEAAPPSAHSASAVFSGSQGQLEIIRQGGIALLTGRLDGVPAGKNPLLVRFLVRMPFSIQQSERSHESLPGGGKRVSYKLSLYGIATDCASAQIGITEPYSGISSLNVSSLSPGSSVQGASALQMQNSTEISFSLSRISNSSPSSVLLSYTLADAQSALAEALAQAEWQAAYFNRTHDALLLSEAKSLAAANRTTEALSLLSRMKSESEQLSYSSADYFTFTQEREAAQQELSSALAAKGELAAMNFTDAAALLSIPIAGLQSEIAQADSVADAKGYQKALSQIRKAKGDFDSDLASISWKYLSETGERYAKAQPGVQASSQAEKERAQSSLSEAQRLFSQGDYAGAMKHAAIARSSISSLAQSEQEQGMRDSAAADIIRQEYSSLRKQAEPLLAAYSSQYSALSSQGKRQLPISPSEANSRLSEADKLLEASKKASLPPSQALSQANSSYQRLISLSDLINSSLSSLGQSAAASLSTASSALAEAKQRLPGSPEVGQIESEVKRAESLLANSLYADSLASSERAISAASRLLSSQPGTDMRHLLLGAISIALLAAGAYYFTRGRKKPKEEGKKEIPKAEEDGA